MLRLRLLIIPCLMGILALVAYGQLIRPKLIKGDGNAAHVLKSKASPDSIAEWGAVPSGPATSAGRADSLGFLSGSLRAYPTVTGLIVLDTLIAGVWARLDTLARLGTANTFKTQQIINGGLGLKGVVTAANYYRILPATDHLKMDLGYWVSGAWYTGSPAITINYTGQVGVRAIPDSVFTAGNAHFTSNIFANNRIIAGTLTPTSVDGYLGSGLATSSGTVGRAYIQGSSQADFLLDNSGGGTDVKILQFLNQQDSFKIRKINDPATVATNLFTISNKTKAATYYGNLTAPTATFATRDSGKVAVRDTVFAKWDSISSRLAAVHTVMWGGLTGAVWDTTIHRWGKRDSVDSLEASGYFKMPYLGSFGTPLLNFSGEMKINKSGAWYLGSGAVTRLLDQTDFLSPRDSVHSGYIYSDTAGNRPGVLAGDTILGNARQCLSAYSYLPNEFHATDTIHEWIWPDTFLSRQCSIIVYRIDVHCGVPSDVESMFDNDSLELLGKSMGLILKEFPTNAKYFSWLGRVAFLTRDTIALRTKIIGSEGLNDVNPKRVNVTVWYYPKPHGPGGAAWKGLASIIHPALGYALAILALGGAALAKFKKRRRGKDEKENNLG